MVNLDSGNNCYYVDKNLLQITNATSCEVITSGQSTSAANTANASAAAAAAAIAGSAITNTGLAKRHSSCTNPNRRTSSNTVFGGSTEVKKNLSESCVIDATIKSSSPTIASSILPKREYQLPNNFGCVCVRMRLCFFVLLIATACASSHQLQSLHSDLTHVEQPMKLDICLSFGISRKCGTHTHKIFYFKSDKVNGQYYSHKKRRNLRNDFKIVIEAKIIECVFFVFFFFWFCVVVIEVAVFMCCVLSD